MTRLGRDWLLVATAAPRQRVRRTRRVAEFLGHGEARGAVVSSMVTYQVRGLLLREAERRNMALGALTGALLENVADDRLFNAVLDP